MSHRNSCKAVNVYIYYIIKAMCLRRGGIYRYNFTLGVSISMRGSVEFTRSSIYGESPCPPY